jgi:UDPglucose 6-dehydrogenase
MNVTVIGSGYVGLVVGACLAETGNRVICADVDAEKIKSLSAGQVPIFEPGLDRLIERNLAEGRLEFTSEVEKAARHRQVIFIAVGTPSGEDGSADLHHVLDVAATIGPNISDGTIVITKSTVPVGTASRVREEIERHTNVSFHVCSNPEFLKEGAAIDDFMRPDRIVCGVESDEARVVLQELYDPFVRSGNPLIFMDIPSAELTKYAANAMLATRISFMNQLALLCEATGADVNRVRKGIGSDPRIGRSFLYAGAGYGGSCFPKDVRALIHTGDEFEVDLTILRKVHEANERQKALLAEKAGERFGEDFSGLRFAVWGLAFKPETDDMREAPALALIEQIVEAGGRVVAHDPVAQDAARELDLGERVEFADDEYAACDSADALFVVTEWFQYRRPDWQRIRDAMRNPIVFDGRNLFEPWRMRELGYEYYPIGREQVR